MAIYGNSIYMVQESLEERLFENFDFVTEAVDKEKLKATIKEKINQIKKFIKEKFENFINFLQEVRKTMVLEIKDKIEQIANAKSESLKEALYVNCCLFPPNLKNVLDGLSSFSSGVETFSSSMYNHITKNEYDKIFSSFQEKITAEAEKFEDVSFEEKEMRIASVSEANKLAKQLYQDNIKYTDLLIDINKTSLDRLSKSISNLERMSDRLFDRYYYDDEDGEDTELYQSFRDFFTIIKNAYDTINRISRKISQQINSNKRVIIELFTAVNKVKSMKITDVE